MFGDWSTGERCYGGAVITRVTATHAPAVLFHWNQANLRITVIIIMWDADLARFYDLLVLRGILR